ncbi:hypothetical protein VNO77_40900 [Canavalia gladiata]|uniref:Uncharacterized protein n=1 Tax=Canavalia gladiata TaxID=3824 RepID=A0AAN9PRK6_CANGL
MNIPVFYYLNCIFLRLFTYLHDSSKFSWDYFNVHTVKNVVPNFRDYNTGNSSNLASILDVPTFIQHYDKQIYK